MSEPNATPAQAEEKELLTPRCADHGIGVLGSWIRVIITGTFTGVCHAGAMEAWLRRDHIHCFDLKVFAQPLRDQMREHAILTV